jgi:hypothetical protein
MKFRVTGGPEGDRGIDSGGRRYEPGDIIEMTQAKAQWLIDKGLLEADGGKSAKSAPAPKPEPEPEPDVDDDILDDPDDDDLDDLDEEID